MFEKSRGFRCLHVMLLLTTTVVSGAERPVFRSAWATRPDRVWVGRDFWACRLQDWRVRGGRVECVEASKGRPMRTLHLLTVRAGEEPGTLSLRVRTGLMDSGKAQGKAVAPANTWTGFLIGAGGEHVDYRLTALTQNWAGEDGGLIVAIDGAGGIVFRDNTRRGRPVLKPAEQSGPGFGGKLPKAVELRLDAKPDGKTYALTLSAYDVASGELIRTATVRGVTGDLVDGGIALVSHRSVGGGDAGYWFDDLEVGGSKIVRDENRAFGPIFCAQHTLSRGTLKMTAQMPPLGKQDTRTAELQIRDGESWRTVARSTLVENSYTFPFRVENWDASKDTAYRVVYVLRIGKGTTQTHTWEGKIRAEPTAKHPFVLAAFTGHKIFTGVRKWNRNGVWFPHNDIVRAVKHHEPDLLFFSGDQVYEGDLTGSQRQPLAKAYLDYLDKWYRWCWAFGDLARDVPCICIPDDHDVYHGNLWGAGGKKADGIAGKKAQDSGGYVMPASFVNAVQRTQTSHLPDPYDPAPVKQGITVYTTALVYGGISFAILEDRKWKSSPTVAVPEGRAVNGWFQNADFDPVRQADVPGAVLLGERQLKFLRVWGADYRDGVWMKVALSQTIFANVATLPADATSDTVVPKFKFVRPDEYVRGDKLAADADSNGWPQTGRNNAVRELRRALALHVAGDQHLGSFIRYGVEAWDDAGYAFCVPSIANTWPRRWYPPHPGRNRRPGAPAYTGRYKDGFGNFVTVHAVSNPRISGHEPAALHDRSPGYGLVRFDRETRDITVACWPRWADPSKPGAKQYPGWPYTFNQLDNDGREAAAFLPTLEIEGMTDPVVQIVDDAGRILYTLRIPGRRFTPKVFEPGSYTIRVGEPGTEKMKTFENVTSVDKVGRESITVRF